MTKLLTVGDESFNFPEQGNVGWGEEATDWAEQVSNTLANVVGPQDILLRETPLNNNQTTFADVVGLKFDVSKVQQVIVEGLITRKYTDGFTEAESFRAEGIYDGSNFYITIERSGSADTEVTLEVLASGQFQYKSGNKLHLGNATDTISIKYRGQAIADT
jgi:hypothetical protein